MVSKLLAAAATLAACASSAFGTDADTAGVRFMAQKLGEWEALKAAGAMPRADLSSEVRARQVCPGGESGGSINIAGENFPCRKVDFESFISLNDLYIENSCAPTVGLDRKGVLLKVLISGVSFLEITEKSPLCVLTMGYGLLTEQIRRTLHVLDSFVQDVLSTLGVT